MLADSLMRAVQTRGGRAALICADRRFTWHDLADRIRRFGGGLLDRGVSSGDRVALLLANTDACFALFHAVPWVGAVLVPLNCRLSVSDAVDCVRDCRPRLLISDDRSRALAEAVALETGTPLLVGAESNGPDSFADLLGRRAAPPSGRTAADLLAIFYTGGTTGRPKGVMLSCANISFNALSNLAEGLFGADAIYLHASPAFHIAGAMGIFNCVVSGATSVMLPHFEPQAVLRTVQKERCTETLLVPTMIQMLLDHPERPQLDTSSLRRVLYGASPISEAILDRALEAWPRVEFVQLYGMTELSPVCTVLHHRELDIEGRAKDRHRAAGRATFGVRVAILGEDDVCLPPGQVGEIGARGDNVMLGYWERPEETAAALRNGWMHTGDCGFLDADGFVFVVDRLKDMIITGGENVFSVEVENVLAKHPAVRQCAVIGIPHPIWGEQVHAVLVLHDGYDATETELRAWCREHLGGFKAPRSFELRSGGLPVSPAGKVLKRELRAPYWSNSKRQVS